ncbi:hypothetical protein Tco_0258456, partial [Tanacetum coccineum]
MRKRHTTTMRDALNRRMIGRENTRSRRTSSTTTPPKGTTSLLTCGLTIPIMNSSTPPATHLNRVIPSVAGEERIKAAFEEFKRLEDEKVEQRCAEMDARLDALSIDFDEELYPHMLTTIAGRRCVIGHGLRLEV